MVTSQQVKEFAKHSGADLVGIASMDRFEGAPKQMDPRYIFPDAKAMIVMAFRIPRGCFRGIEEGTYFANYTSFGYYHINLVYAMDVLREVTLFLEDEGYEGVPYDNTSVRLGSGRGRAVAPGLPRPDIFIHFRLAAVAAGLGEIGWSKVFLTPEYGPRQRFALILTDAPLEPDPIFEGQICDRCMSCVSECSGKAIHPTKSISVRVAGKLCEWGELDTARCAGGFQGGVPETNPFLPDDVRQELTETLENYAKDEPEIRAEYSGSMFRALRERVPITQRAWDSYHHPAAIEGAKGCIRACMIHLEETGRIKARFVNPFRKKKPWSLTT